MLCCYLKILNLIRNCLYSCTNTPKGIYKPRVSLHSLFLVHVITTGCFGLGRKASGFTTHRHGSTLTNFRKTTCSPSSTSTVNNRNTHTSSSHKSYSRTLGRLYILLTTRGHSSFFKSQTRLFKDSNSFPSHFKALVENIPLGVDNRASRCPAVCVCVSVIFTG